jgi:hypothetical protein
MEPDFAEFLKMMGDSGDDHTMTPIRAEDIEGGFEPIPDLKPGDKVRMKANPKLKEDRWPKPGEIITVYKINPVVLPRKLGEIIRHPDFTTLFDDGTTKNSIMEFAYDSRRFERVE